MEKSWNAAMRSMFFLFCAFVAMTATAKEKTVVWQQPTTEFGTCYGDGFFNLVLDVTKVELKDTETVVYITAQQRSDYPEYSFQFVGDTYLKVGEQRFTIVSADGVELNKFVQTNKNNLREMVWSRCFPDQGHQTRGRALETVFPLLLVRRAGRLEDSLLRGLCCLRLQVLELQTA